MSPKPEVWVQVTAGQGPVECAWAVVKVVEALRAEAENGRIGVTTLAIEPGPQPATALSALLCLSGSEAALASLSCSWQGTVQLVASSPFRPDIRRKNWFVGVSFLEAENEMRFDEREVRWETMRASGPGGQHVNRTESAVRVTHLPTGIQASASEERSQHRNRRLALTRLGRKLAEFNAARQNARREGQWRAHHDLQRGNPVRVLRAITTR